MDVGFVCRRLDFELARHGLGQKQCHQGGEAGSAMREVGCSLGQRCEKDRGSLLPLFRGCGSPSHGRRVA